MKKVVAIVEDEPMIRANYKDALERQGYTVQDYASRVDALAGFEVRLPDLAIIDVGLGDEVEGGFELCRELRSASRTLPIIFLTARDSEIDQISGLRLGADDYLTKDISLPHMMARITALFRRIDVQKGPVDVATSLLQRGRLSIDLDRMVVRWNQQPIQLTVTEFWIVHALAKHPGHVKNRDQLMEAANTVLDDSTVTSHIKRIRKKFQHEDAQFKAIQTAYGMGYKWDPSEH